MAVFAEGRAIKSQTALGNRWPGVATSDPDLITTVRVHENIVICSVFCEKEVLEERCSGVPLDACRDFYEVWPRVQLRNLVFYDS